MLILTGGDPLVERLSRDLAGRDIDGRCPADQGPGGAVAVVVARW
jgi:hypothetical protein